MQFQILNAMSTLFYKNMCIGEISFPLRYWINVRDSIRERKKGVHIKIQQGNKNINVGEFAGGGTKFEKRGETVWGGGDS